MTRARKTPSRRAPNPLTATLAVVETDLPAAPRGRKPTPTFLPDPGAKWRALRAHWIGKRGELPAVSLPSATFPATTVADVVEVANHVTAALRNDVGRVDPVIGRRIWDRWRESVEKVRKQVADARDDAALYQENETLWEDSILHIVWFMPRKPRNASQGRDTAPSHQHAAAVAAVDGDSDGPSSPPPPIREVEILWTDNPQMQVRSFSSLWEADAALARAVASNRPPHRDGYEVTGFRIVWSDDKVHTGHIVENPKTVAEGATRGGMIRVEAENIAAYLTSARCRGRWMAEHGDDDPEGLAKVQAWGRDLRARLDADRLSHVDASSVRNVGKRIVSKRPAILAVDIKWSDDDTLPTGRFASLAAADQALSDYFTSSPPQRAHYRITYYVTFADGAAHQGRIELPVAAIPEWIQKGGILRHHLLTEGAKQRKEGGRLRVGLRTDAADDALALGSIEFQRRIKADTTAHKSAPTGSKRAKREAPDAPMADLRSTDQASSWIAAMPSPPRLLPAPQERFHELYRALQGAFDDGRIDWRDPRVNAFVNYITRALRTEVPLLDAGDATIIWWRWREAVRAFQQNRTDEDHADIYYRALTIARQVGYSLRDPGSVYQAFCPWRALYFDRASDPTTRARRSRMEVDPWAA